VLLQVKDKELELISPAAPAIGVRLLMRIETVYSGFVALIVVPGPGTSFAVTVV
jgi:hypothetical protein